MRPTLTSFRHLFPVLLGITLVVIGLACSLGSAPGSVAPAQRSDPSASILTIETSETLGTLPGSFRVDQNGAANYSIQLATPPGTAGLAPSLSLGYNSHYGNSVVGQGWSLGGISFIQRCAVTRNGQSHPVTYTAADRFCLDGKLLVAVDGEYGASGTAYATEIQNWQRIVSTGVCGSGPCEFTVTTKDGRMISLFGGTADSRGEAVEVCSAGKCSIPAGSVRVWGLNRVSDPYGNFIDYRYDENSETGEISPSRILYTGNDAQGLPTQRAVEFHYASRPDPIEKYSGGALVPLTVRLDRLATCIAEGGITDCSNSTQATGFRTVAGYDFTYSEDSLTGLSLLDSVRMSGADGQSFPATRFDYGGAAEAFSEPATWSTSYPESTWRWPLLRTMADVNGDGRGDIIGFGNTKVALSLAGWDSAQGAAAFNDVASQDLGFFTTSTGYSDPATNPRFAADVNGDGRGDIIGFGNTCVAVGMSLGEQFQVPEGSVSGCSGANVCSVDLVGPAWKARQRQASDLDGDGRADLIGFGETETVFALSDGQCFADQQSTTLFSDRDGYQAVDPRVLADVNGDGVADVVAFRSGGAVDVGLTTVSDGQVQFVKSEWSNDFVEPGRSAWDLKLPRTVVDVNGDGQADLVGFGDETVIVALSTGKSFTTPTVWTSGLTGFVSVDDLLTFGDVNGDGLADAIGFNTVQNKVVFGVSTGRSFDVDRLPPFPGFGTGSGYPDETDYPRFIGDVTGAGLVDVVGFGSSKVSVSVGPNAQPTRLVAVTDGLGGRRTIDYQSISGLQQDVYTPAAYDAEPPCSTCRAYQNNTLVVSAHSVEDDRGDTYRYRYGYAGAAWDSSGHGYLGFAERTVIDEQIARKSSPPGVATVTTYHQDFPLSGSPARVEAYRVADELTLLEQRFEYCSTLGQPCPGESPVGVYVTGLTNQETVHHDEFDDHTYTTAQRYSYDRYGNTLLSEDLGDLAVADDDLTTCTNYRNDPASHHLGFPIEVVQSASCEVDSSGESCSCSTPLTWSRSSFDERWSLESQRGWDDTTDSWLGEQFDYDGYGNQRETRQAYWKNDTATPFQTSTTTYDPVFHAFPTEHSNGLWSIEQRYDAAFGVLIEETDQNDLQRSSVLDGFGRPLAHYGPDPSGKTVEIQTFSYQGQARLIETRTLTEWQGGETSYQRQLLDGLGRTWQQAQQTSSGADLLQDTEYDAENRVGRRSLPYFSGETPEWTELSYDALERLSEVVLPTSERSIITYDIEPLDGVLRARSVRTDAVGTADERQITAFTDASGAVLQRIYPGAATDGSGSSGQAAAASFDYDRLHQLREVDSPGGVRSTLGYDTLGRIVTSTSTNSGTSSYRFDLEGNLASTVDARGQTVDMTYDSLGRPATQRAAGAPGFDFSYDQSGHGFGIGYLTSVSSTGDDGLSLSYDYGSDGLRRRSEIGIDGVSFAQWMEHDPQGRLQRLVYPDGAIERRSYTLAGYLDEISLCSDPDACAAERYEIYATYGSFTALGKPERVEYGAGTLQTNLDYYSLGNLRSVRLTRSNGTDLIDRSFQWNPLFSLTEIEDRLDPTASRSMRYDAAGYLQTVEVGGASSWNYGYDAAGNLTDKNDLRFTYVGQQVVAGTRGGETVFSASYDANGDLEHRVRTSSDGSTTSWDLAFDPYQRLTTVTRETVSAEATAKVADRFLYDDQGRLVKKASEDGTLTYYVSANYEATVLGDGKGVVYTKYLDGPSGRVASLSVQSPSLSSQLPAQPESPGAISALLSSWNETISRLTSGHPVQALLFLLIALLVTPIVLSVLRQLGASSAEARTDYVARRGKRALIVPVLLFTVLVLTAGQAMADLEPGANGVGVPQDGVSYFFQDQVGSTALVTDRDGVVTAEVSYLPYGEIDQSASAGTDDFRAKFDGKEWMDGSGLYFFSSRFYDPFTGRFASADNQLFGGPDTNAAALNRYAYVENNPLTFSDPSGHSVSSSLAMVAMTTVAAAATLVVGPAAAMFAGAAYAGASAVNHSGNPKDWNWKSWKTYGGMLAGIGITVAAVAVAAVVAVAMATGVGEVVTGVAAALGIEAVGGFAVADIAGVVGGLAGSVAAGSLSMAGSNAAFTALGGGSVQDILKSAARGAVAGAVIGAVSFGAGAIGGEVAGSLAGVEVEAADLASVEAEEVGELGSAGDGLEEMGASCTLSFPAGTAVAMAAGQRPIEELTLDDQVWAFDQATDEPAVHALTALYSRTATELVAIQLASDEIRATPEHPFWVEGSGWVEAGNLRPGDRLRSLDGAQPMVLSVERVQTAGKVFNLEVQTAHTYYVSPAQVLVHNCGGDDEQPRGGTYKLVDDDGRVMRTGRSKDLERRQGEHARNPQFRDLTFEVDRRTDSYPAQRGREQIIHDQYNPPYDKMRGIDPKNPRRDEYMRAGRELDQ